MAFKKKFYYKVFNSAGNYITTWRTDVISTPSFRDVLNGGSGELNITLGRMYNSFGENVDVALGNKVQLYSGDKMSPSGILLYSGYISQYSPVIDGSTQNIQITCLGYVTELSNRVLKDASGNTTITYTNKDPAVIMQDVIDKYRADGGVNVFYKGSIRSTGVSATYTFTNNTIKECLDKIIILCPDGWFYFIDASGVVWLKQVNKAYPDHVVSIGRNITKMEVYKRLENMANRVFIVGGGVTPLYNRYDRTGSQSSYGLFEHTIEDGNVTDNTTSDLVAKRYLDQNSIPESRSLITILDNTGQVTDAVNSGSFWDIMVWDVNVWDSAYDPYMSDKIDLYSVGDSIQIKNLKYGVTVDPLWDVFKWDINLWDNSISDTAADIMTIVSKQYDGTSIELEATSRFPELEKTVNEITRSVNTLIQEGLPVSPSVRTV